MASDEDTTRPNDGARVRLAIAEITSTLTTDFDLPTLLDTVADKARIGFQAHSAVVLLLDHRSDRDDGADIQNVAQAQRNGSGSDLTFQSSGPGLHSARDGAVAMIADLADADAEDTRWPGYRSYAAGRGIRGVRAFPIVALGTPLGSVVVHTDDPWGTARPNDFGQTLANLVAIALSVGASAGRRGDTTDTVNELLRGMTAIATATGIIAEALDMDADEARLALQRLARSHGQTASRYAHAVLAAQREHPGNPGVTGIFRPPTDPVPPQHIDR